MFKITKEGIDFKKKQQKRNKNSHDFPKLSIGLHEYYNHAGLFS